MEDITQDYFTTTNILFITLQFTILYLDHLNVKPDHQGISIKKHD